MLGQPAGAACDTRFYAQRFPVLSAKPPASDIKSGMTIEFAAVAMLEQFPLAGTCSRTRQSSVHRPIGPRFGRVLLRNDSFRPAYPFQPSQTAHHLAWSLLVSKKLGNMRRFRR